MNRRNMYSLRGLAWLLTMMILVTSLVTPAMAAVTLNLGRKGSLIEGSTVTITWNKMDDIDHYEFSLRDITNETTSATPLYDHKNVGTKTEFRIGVDLLADHTYRAWVGAIVNGSDPEVIPGTHQNTLTFTMLPEVCEHDGKTYWDYSAEDRVYESLSDSEHRITTTYDLCCYECDEVLKSNQVSVETDDHYFDDNGDCLLCDYRFSCDHKYKELDITNSGYTMITGDDEVHTYFETGWRVCANANCGKVIERYDYSEKQEHSFTNNTCKYCGYIRNEPLSVVVARGQQTAVAGESISATATAVGGSGSLEYAWEVLCDGAVIENTAYSVNNDYSYVTNKAGSWQFKVYVRDTISEEVVTATTNAIIVSEATCNHTNPENETIDTDYIKASDTKHEIRTYYNVVCSDCGDVLSEGNYNSEIVDHVVDASGQCICGYTAPTETCSHTSSKPEQIGEPKVEQFDEKWHKVITTYQDICANNDCGVILVASREETAMVAHTYDSNGQCTCGYVQPTDKCDHAPIETLVDTDYVEIDGTGHEIIRKYHYECECGQVNYDDTRTATEPHVFENGPCVCGRTEAVAITYDGSFSQDSYTMTVGEKLNVNVTASTTNANLSRVTINVDSTGNDRLAYADINGGTNWNGTLTLDGANAPLNVPGTYTIKLFVKVNNDDNAWAEVDQATLTVAEAAGCPHTSVEEYWEMTEGYSVTYKSVSDTHHTASGHMYKFCTLCLSRVGDIYPVTIDETHSFDAAGDCILCDYRVSCQHKETKPKVETSGYTSKGEEGHLFFQYGNLVCANANCGKEVEPYYAEEMQDHTFSDNTCSLCGYSKAEELSVVVARGQSSAETGDIISATATAKGGSGSYKYAWEVICEGVVVNFTDYSMPSSYSYVADDIGSWTFKVYVKDASTGDVVTATTSVITVEMAACPHDLINTIQQGDPQYIKISDTVHEIRTYYNDTCGVCGDVTRADYYKSETAAHNPDANGKCVCGYAAPTPTCDHANSIPQQIGQPTVEKFDEKWHEVIYIYKDVCANEACQTVLNERREVREMVVHSFDANGKCACGYVLPTVDCDHVAAKTELNPKYIAVDASCHHFTVTYHYECECGQVNYDEDAQSFDPHVYEGRICKLCGFENPCDHADFQKVISSVVEDDKNSNSTHFVVTTYTKICECGAVNPTPIVRTTVPCSFTKSAGVQAKHESQGHQYFDRCACGNATVNGKFKNYLSSCATCQQQYGDDALAKGTYNSSRVEELQQMLGFTGNAIDGDFGGNTESAVKEFQKKHGLPVTGIVDDATWAKLVAESNKAEISTSPDDVNDEKHTHVYENGVCSDCGETCKHAYGAYYDDNLISRQFCIYCEPRTDAEKSKDIENLERYVNKMKADIARNNVTSLSDPASILLSGIQEQNEAWYMQVASYAFKTASFQWGDVVKKAVPGSMTVDEVRRESIQASVAATLATSTSNSVNADDQLEFENALLEMAGLTIQNSDTVLDVAGHINDITGLGTDMYNRFGGLNFNIIGQFTKYETVRASLPTNAQIKDQFVNKSGGMKAGVVLTALGFAIDCGVDIGEYAAWSDNQRELFYATTEQAAENVAFLEELMATYPDDDVLVEYCKDTIEGIERSMNNDVSNWITEAGDWINNAAETGGDLAQIIVTNGAEATTNFAVPAAFAVVFQTGGSALTLAGTGAGLVAEWTVGTDTTADNAEDIDILYTYVGDSVDAYNAVANSNSVSDDVKRFQEFNILNMKIAGLEMAADINKVFGGNGVNAETANGLISSYEQYRQDLLLGE